MKDKSVVIKLLELLTLILLYYITRDDNLFLYASTLSLYNIFISCFSHITIKEKLKKNKDDYSKLKLLKYVGINITIVYLLFVILSIFIGDTINTSLNIKNTFLPYLIMSISIITEPLIKILLEYLESYNKPKLSNSLFNLYYIIEYILVIIISLVTIKFIKLPINISISLLYLSKIISFITITVIMYLSLKKINIDIKTKPENNIKYKKEIKEILTNNSHKSIINIVKNSYYYISIILLYTVLTTRYSYDIATIEKNITFIYLYGISIINVIISIIKLLTNHINKKDNIINYIYIVFDKTLATTITLAVTSPLICKIIFLKTDNAIYLSMLSFLLIFIILYNITFDYIKNTKVIYISLIAGIISKLVLTIPLINSFYRMGYNLVYGDIISTIISMSISLIINYVYIKINTKNKKTIEKILKTLYESMLLCIILVLMQFIIPIKEYSYIKTLAILILYITTSMMFFEQKKKKRG